MITGTPGTGKTSHAAAFVEASPFEFEHLNIGDIVKERGCHEGWNEEWQSYDVDDDRVSAIEAEQTPGYVWLKLGATASVRTRTYRCGRRQGDRLA